MTNRSHCAALALAFIVILPPMARAQGPWTVTVTPTLNPLPIGFCGAVHLLILDKAGNDVPRNGAGYRVTMADFDMTVTAPEQKAFVGQQIDDSHWSVCSCQGATVGTVGTIVATYPAKQISPRARVPGVNFQTSATVTLARAKGEGDPAGCSAPAPSPVVTLSPPLNSLPPKQGPVTGTPATPSPVALPDQPVSGKTVPTPVAPPPVGPEPKYVSVTGTPAEAVVSWQAPYTYSSPAPTGYVVQRSKMTDSLCCRATSPTLTVREWRDPVMWPGEWRYIVTAIYADGRRGSAWNRYTYVEPESPTGLKAEQIGRDTVVLTWQPVMGASYYAVAGPPNNTTVRVDSPRVVRTGLPLGATTWKVAAMYEAKDPAAPKQGSLFATTSLDVVRRHYRLVAEAVRVTSETVDPPLSEDGKYDEIFLASHAELIERTEREPVLVKSYPFVLSAVHGDISFWPPPQRIKAGTASGNGGVRAGDVVSPIWSRPMLGAPMGTPDFVLWEGELIGGKHDLILHPTVWELDQKDTDLARSVNEICYNGALCGWQKSFTNAAPKSRNSPAVRAAMAGAQIAIVDGIMVFGPSYIVHLENFDQDRPLGLEVGSNAPQGMGVVGAMRDKVVVLSREKIEAALASNANKIEIRFWDHSTLPNVPPAAVNNLNGDYTLVIRIERMP